MTSQFDFSASDWNVVASTPVLVGLAVAKAEDSGYFGSKKETKTLDSNMAANGDESAARSLIEQAVTTETSPEVEAAMALPAAALADAAVAACTELTEILGATTEPKEAQGYKSWVLNVANEVAEAAKEDGVRVSPGEAALINRVRDALSLTPAD